jgi:hypothetical protein
MVGVSVKDSAVEVRGGAGGKDGVGSDEQLVTRGRAVAGGDGQRGAGRGQVARAGLIGVRGGGADEQGVQEGKGARVGSDERTKNQEQVAAGGEQTGAEGGARVLEESVQSEQERLDTGGRSGGLFTQGVGKGAGDGQGEGRRGVDNGDVVMLCAGHGQSGRMENERQLVTQGRVAAGGNEVGGEA